MRVEIKVFVWEVTEMPQKWYRWKDKVSIMPSFTPEVVRFVSRFTQASGLGLQEVLLYFYYDPSVPNCTTILQY